MGYIIVIEGTDGSGKATQSEQLKNRLERDGYNVIRQSFPNYDSPSSAPVKMYLGGEFGDNDKSMDAYQASVLYAVDRLCTYQKSLKDFYENDGVIIFDRYVESNMLHQAGKIDDRDELDKYLAWLDNLEFDLLKLPRANMVVFLDVPVEKSIELARARDVNKSSLSKDIHENSDGHLQNAYRAGKYVGNKRGWNFVNCIKDESLRQVEDIADEIYDLVRTKLKEVK